jgi:hypothetical protein
MKAESSRCYIVHDRAGHILAVAPSTTVRVREGVNLGWRPIAGRNQVVTEIQLDNEQVKLPLHELLDFKLKIDARSGVPCLQRRKQPRAPHSRRTS